MSKLFRPKTMRRMVVFLAMVAPAVYLFGSLFSALTGAHGVQVFADDYYSDSLSGDVPLTQYAVINANSGEVQNGGANQFVTLDYFQVSSGLTYSFTSSQSNMFIYRYDSDKVYTSYQSGFFQVANFAGWDGFVRLYVGSNDFVSSISYTVSGEDLQPVIDSVNYSDYLFSQFFAKDNFLVRWGLNAISDSPYGFAPFGYFWRYLDVNVLHFSNDQAGLMAYGYMYYASHVLLFDVGFILVTFFLTFIQKVADKIGGEDHA